MVERDWESGVLERATVADRVLPVLDGDEVAKFRAMWWWRYTIKILNSTFVYCRTVLSMEIDEGGQETQLDAKCAAPYDAGCGQGSLRCSTRYPY